MPFLNKSTSLTINENKRKKELEFKDEVDRIVKICCRSGLRNVVKSRDDEHNGRRRRASVLFLCRRLSQGFREKSQKIHRSAMCKAEKLVGSIYGKTK
jgi:hypothetical protein